MTKIHLRKTLLIPSIIFLVSGCITSRSFYDKKHQDWEKANSPDSLKLKYSVFLIGDAGLPSKDRQEPTFRLLQSQLYSMDTIRTAGGRDSIVATSRKEDAVIFLGDNIYETGLPEPDASDREEKERRITEQLKIVKSFRGRTIFVPGNHDWNESRPGGLEAINRQEQFIESYLDSADVMLPSNGCSGPVEVPMGDDMVIIAIDTEWWLHKYRKPLAPDNGCSAASRIEVIRQVRDILLRNKGKHIILAQHHPLFSNGKHGGVHTLKDYIFPLTLVRDRLFIPLPVIGSIYPLMRQYGISRQDLSNQDYYQLKTALLSILEDEKNVVIAAGHEHALQFNKYKDVNHIISGAGTKANALARGLGATFGSGSKGFARLNYYDNGQCWVEFWSPEGDGSTGKLLFRTPLYAIPPTTRQEIAEEKQVNYTDSVRVIAAGPQYSAGTWKEKWFGEHYRSTWATPIRVSYLDPATYAGGLTPLKLGGGKQTTSLQLQGKDGNLYQFRTVSKDPSSLLPEGFARTFADDFIQDQISSAHPYGGIIVPGMARAVGVFNVAPKLVYMPHSRVLGPYLAEVGGKLGTIEARPDEDVSDFKIFGNANNAISTRKLYEELREDNDHMVDQEMFLRARLFDILIGDWDRHEDQWRWAEFKTENSTLYKPIARDRDQAFPKYDGIIPGLMKAVVPDLQSFERDFGSIATLSIAARNLDRNFLNQLSAETWVEVATDVQRKLTDDVIEQSVRQMPKEAFALSGREIIEKLKARRSQLVDAAKSYYKVLAREVTIAGSDKKEYFLVNKLDTATRVRVFKINKKDELDTILYDRTFSARETREINLFALDGKDSVRIEGSPENDIKLRVIGGKGEDAIHTEAGSGRTIVFDSKTENNRITGQGMDLRLSRQPWVNAYDPNSFHYDKAGPGPNADYNSDDGIFVGAAYTWRHFGFRKDPYSFQQKISVLYAPKTDAHSIAYAGDFYSVFGHRSDLVARISYNGPQYTFNYYGLGNSTLNVGDDADYYRVRTRNFSFNTYFQRRFSQAFRVGIGPGYEYYRTEKPENRYVSSADFPQRDQIEAPSYYATLRTFAHVDFVDDPVFPTSGVRWQTQADYFRELTSGPENFLQFRSKLSFYLTPNVSFPVTFALRVGGARNFGDYKFFQANSLGGNTFLRGYRNNRFAGTSYLFQNSELRFRVSNFRNYIFTGNLGLFGFFDAGRVYSGQPENNTWHTGLGPGLWINLYHKFMVSTAYGISHEGRYFTVRTGITF